MTVKAPVSPASAAPAVVAKSVTRAADKLGISNKVLAAIIGVSEPTVSRLRSGDYALQQGQKPFELSTLLIRLYRSLDAVVGGDDTVAAQWLRNDNVALGGKPIALIQTIAGLTNVLAYLDARRAVA